MHIALIPEGYIAMLVLGWFALGILFVAAMRGIGR